MREMQRYDAWKSGGSYYDWPPPNVTLTDRYFAVVKDTLALIVERAAMVHHLIFSDRFPAARAPLGYVRLGSKEVAVAFDYPLSSETTEKALLSDEWRRLHDIIREFRNAARGMQIVPLVAFIPTKLEVYSHLLSDRSGAKLLVPQRNPAAEEVLERIAAELEIAYIDLAGRQVAAEIIAKRLMDFPECRSGKM